MRGKKKLKAIDKMFCIMAKFSLMNGVRDVDNSKVVSKLPGSDNPFTQFLK